MARWNHDNVDVACGAWAFQWTCLFRKDPIRAREYLGALRSTLGSVPSLKSDEPRRRSHVLHASSRSEGRIEQHFPEVFLGYGLVVAVALQYAAFTERQIIYMHYLERRYDTAAGEEFKRLAPRKVMAARIGIHPSLYAHRLNAAKAWIGSALSLDTKDLAIARAQAVESAKLDLLPPTSA